jgi:hypothetical protein
LFRKQQFKNRRNTKFVIIFLRKENKMLQRRRLPTQQLEPIGSKLSFGEQVTVLRYAVRRWAVLGLLAFLTVLGLAIAAFFFPLNTGGGGGGGSNGNSFSASDLTCSAESNNTIDAVCLPQDVSFNSIHVNHTTTLYENITFMGNVYCSTPIWPSCLDISGQTCEYPLQQSCMPHNVSNWSVLGNLTLGNQLVCAQPLSSECIGQNLTLNSLTVTHLTVLNMTETSVSYYEQLTLNNTEQVGPFVCSGNGNISPGCIDISGEICTAPISNGCMQPRIKTLNGISPVPGTLDFTLNAGSNVVITPGVNSLTISSTIPTSMVLSDLTVNNNLTLGPASQLVCSNVLNTSCIPLRIGSLNGVAPNAATFDFQLLAGTNMNITTGVLPNSLVFNSIVPSNLTLDFLTIDGGVSMTCTGGGSISDDCLPPRIKTINGIAPTALPALDFTIVGDGSSIAIVPQSNGIRIESTGNISNGTCAGGPIAAACIPVNLTLNTLYVDHLFTSNMTTINIGNQNVDMFMSNNTIQKGPFTCNGGGYVDPNCVDISGETCTSPIGDSCMPVRIKSINGILPNAGTLNFGLIAGPGITVTSGTNQITVGADISNSSCTAPIGESCLPSKVSSINGIFSDSATHNFGILGSSSVTVVGGANQITLFANVSGATCVTPMAESCLPSKVTSINGILSDPTTHNFGLVGGTGITVVGGTNQLTLNANISGLSCSTPLNSSCLPLRVGSINSILPSASTFNFNVLAGSNIAVTPATNGVTISSDISGTMCSMPINANCVQIDGETCLAPVADSCMQPRIKTINGISPTASPSLNFAIVAGAGITVTPGTNQITIATTTGISNNNLTYQEVSSTSTISGFNSGSYTVVTGMSMILPVGRWQVSFSTSVSQSSSSGEYQFKIWNGSTPITHSRRYLAKSSNIPFTIATQAVVVSNGVSAVSVQWIRSDGSGSAEMYERSMFALKLN